MFWDLVENLLSPHVLTDPSALGRTILQLYFLNIPTLFTAIITAIMLSAARQKPKVMITSLAISMGFAAFLTGWTLSTPEAIEHYGLGNFGSETDLSQPDLEGRILQTTLKYTIIPTLAIYFFSWTTVLGVRVVYRKIHSSLTWRIYGRNPRKWYEYHVSAISAFRPFSVRAPKELIYVIAAGSMISVANAAWTQAIILILITGIFTYQRHYYDPNQAIKRRDIDKMHPSAELARGILKKPPNNPDPD